MTLPWVEDGMTVDEQEAVIQLLYIASEHPLVAWELARKRWMQDNLSATEIQVIYLLVSVVGVDDVSAEQIVRMPFLDSIARDDLLVLETFSILDREGLRRLLSHPVLTGESTERLLATVVLRRLEWEQPEKAVAIMALPWVGEGMDSSQVKAMLLLQDLARQSPEVFRVLLSTTWVEDGLDRDEMTVVAALLNISGMSLTRRDENAALRIAAMPFLESVDGRDAAAVRSLRKLFWESDEANYLPQVLSHPTLRDGITDDEAIVVAALGLVVRDRPELLDTLLDLEPGAVEIRVVQLPLAGEVTLSVINVDPGVYITVEQLEQPVRAQEGFMDVPFPTTYVGLLVADATEDAGGGGPDGLLTVDPAFLVYDYVIAHEVAHTYWSFSPSWIAEGGADFMTTVSANMQFSAQECRLGDTLSDIDRLRWELTESGQSTDIIKWSGCDYSLGRGLFLDLYDTLGDEAFRRGFKNLYLAMRDGELDDECSGLERGVCYVRAGFVADAVPESAALAEPVIDRWYFGPPDVTSQRAVRN